MVFSHRLQLVSCFIGSSVGDESPAFTMTGLQSQLAHLPRAPCGGAVGGGEARREVPCFRRFAAYGGEGTATAAARRPERCRGGCCEQERAGRGQGGLDRGLIRPVRPCRGRSGHREPSARDRCAGVEGPGAGLLYGGDGALPESPRTTCEDKAQAPGAAPPETVNRRRPGRTKTPMDSENPVRPWAHRSGEPLGRQGGRLRARLP